MKKPNPSWSLVELSPLKREAKGNMATLPKHDMRFMRQMLLVQASSKLTSAFAVLGYVTEKLTRNEYNANKVHTRE